MVGVALKLDSELEKLNEDNSGLEPPAWLTNAKYLTSLLKAYDDRIEELEDNLDSHSQDNQTLQNKFALAVQENTVLREQLTRRGGTSIRPGSDDWKFTQDQIQVLSQENEILTEHQRSAMREVESLRFELTRKTKERMWPL